MSTLLTLKWLYRPTLHTHTHTGRQPTGLSKQWTDLINAMRKPIMKVLLAITKVSANNPKITITSVIFLSCALIVTGLFTNFYLETSEDILFTPIGSKPVQHGDWIDEMSGFDLSPRAHLLLIHADGDNVASQEGVTRAFTALDTIRNTEGYAALCSQTPRSGDCSITSITQFYNNSIDAFTSTVSSDAEVLSTMSERRFPDGRPVDRDTVFGRGVFDENDQLVSAQSYFIIVSLPEVDDAEDFEGETLDRLSAIQDAWIDEPNNKFRVEYFAERSFADEFARAIVSDIPLVPAVFTIMSIFTCIVFFRRDAVYSRSLLGFGATVCVLLAIMAGYGIMFILSIPFTSMTQVRTM